MDTAGEFHAYLIALKTLRERCRYLQQKLEVVEEENSRLKLKMPQDNTEKSPRSTSELSSLQDQVALLTKQKCLLSHQIQMVATENHTLWSRLSKLTTTNQNLGSKLSVISDSLKCLDPNIFPTNSSISSQNNLHSSEYCKESLEEISLKLMNGILLEKTELENQYAQMVDLQNDNEQLEIHNLCFSLPEEDDESVLLAVNKNFQKLNQFKQLLLQQKNDLVAAISALKNFKKNYVCNNCINNTKNDNIRNTSIHSNTGAVDAETVEETGNDLSTLQVHEIGLNVNETQGLPDEKICPFCETRFEGPFEQFYKHVTTHFDDENDTEEYFEVIS